MADTGLLNLLGLPRSNAPIVPEPTQASDMEASNVVDLKVPLIPHEDDAERGCSAEETATPTSTKSGSRHSLGLGALVFLIYYNIGVPFGDEEVGALLCVVFRFVALR